MYWELKLYHPETKKLLEEVKNLPKADDVYLAVIELINKYKLDIQVKRHHINRLARNDDIENFGFCKKVKNLRDIIVINKIGNRFNVKDLKDTEEQDGNSSEISLENEKELIIKKFQLDIEKKHEYNSNYNVFLMLKNNHKKLLKNFEEIKKEFEYLISRSEMAIENFKAT